MKAIIIEYGKTENAYKLANAYPDAKLVLIHWGTVDAPDEKAFNGNPQDIFDHVVNSERVIVLALGQEYKMCQSVLACEAIGA